MRNQLQRETSSTQIDGSLLETVKLIDAAIDRQIADKVVHVVISCSSFRLHHEWLWATHDKAENWRMTRNANRAKLLCAFLIDSQLLIARPRSFGKTVS